MRIARDDTVIIISGDDKGKTGKVLKVFPDTQRVIVEGVNFIKRHTKPRSRMQPGVHISNVMVVCPRCGEGTSPKRTKHIEGRSVRVCSKCNEIVGKT